MPVRTNRWHSPRCLRCLNTACDRITYTGDHRGPKPLKWLNCRGTLRRVQCTNSTDPEWGGCPPQWSRLPRTQIGSAQVQGLHRKDSLNCGLTNIHTVHIPKKTNAKPTFVRQYKIPIALYEPVQEIVDSMLEKGVIRPCNSTYFAPIWPVLKPNTKWRPTIDYRKLNQQVPLSQWPMTQLDRETPKIKGSTILSTLDVASWFWTMPVHPDDQHKYDIHLWRPTVHLYTLPLQLCQLTSRIFLKKTCPDARIRGNLVYADDVLTKSSSVEDHLKEIYHVLNQLTTAGAKIALHKGQWCKTKVNYVGLLVRQNGIEPQSNRTQAIQSIKTVTNVSDLRSFLGVCNYSHSQKCE